VSDKVTCSKCATKIPMGEGKVYTSGWVCSGCYTTPKREYKRGAEDMRQIICNVIMQQAENERLAPSIRTNKYEMLLGLEAQIAQMPAEEV
jgi:hypothetical protein